MTSSSQQPRNHSVPNGRSEEPSPSIRSLRSSSASLPLTSLALPGSVMAAEMAEQPSVFAHLLHRSSSDIAAICALQPIRPVGVVFIARGSSLNACTYAAYAVEVLAQIPVSLARPSVTNRYGARPDYRNWLAIAVSQSGRTPEIVLAAQAALDCGAKLITVTNNPSSPLARLGELHLSTHAGEERAVPATKTVTAQMFCGLTIAQALSPSFLPDLEAAIRKLPSSAAELLSDHLPPRKLAAKWSTFDALSVLSRGMGFAAAHEVALKVREVAGIFGEAWSVTAFRHGPIAGVHSGVAVLNIAMHPHDDEDTAQSLSELVARGVSIASCTPNPSSDLPLPTAHEFIVPFYAVLRGQQLALELALARNRNPDSPEGLNKVTLT